MAATLTGVFPADLQEKVQHCKVLIVGAGGIGCEILKNLVMCGIPDIEIIDLDTIDLSNLNRQFLFQREHVGRPKAVVARESALQFNPDIKIKAYHDSIMATEYGVNFFKRFNVVLGALDNRTARNHVNRMCLNAEVPLIESGTAGYNGQVEMILKGQTQCYECTPKAAQKTYPGCTIRNTPSESIHCIVWAKHLFNQLFGETLDEEDISPDFADLEATDGAVGDSNELFDIVRVNTRLWAREANYDAATLFNKFFHDDINYLLTMSHLWTTRKPPAPVKWDSVLLQRDEGSSEDFRRQYHKIWSLAECAAIFESCLKKLSADFLALPDGESLVWDKDDQAAMDFVAACANVRCQIFNITRKTRFEIKSMAGNIIPAIATTNAITAGVVVLRTLKALQGMYNECTSVYVRLRPNPRRQIFVPERSLVPPNPACIVCVADPAIQLRIDTHRMRIKDLRDEVFIKTLNMVHPDVVIDGKGAVVISSEEGETECNNDKLLSEMQIVDGVMLTCDDFFQNYQLGILINHFDSERDGPLFEVVADKEKLKPKTEQQVPAQKTNGATAAGGAAVEMDIGDGPSTSKRSRPDDDVHDIADDEDDDLVLIEDDEQDDEEITEKPAIQNPADKRKLVGQDLIDKLAEYAKKPSSITLAEIEAMNAKLAADALTVRTVASLADDDITCISSDDDGPSQPSKNQYLSDDDVTEVACTTISSDDDDDDDDDDADNADEDDEYDEEEDEDPTPPKRQYSSDDDVTEVTCTISSDEDEGPTQAKRKRTSDDDVVVVPMKSPNVDKATGANRENVSSSMETE